MNNINKESKYIQGVRVDFGLNKEDFLRLVKDGVERTSGSNYICTVNPEFIMKAQEDREFKDTINSSYLAIPDGVGVLMAEKYLDSIKNVSRKNIFLPFIYFIKGVQVGFKSIFKSDYLGNRLAGSSLVYDMCEMAANNGWKISLIGGWEKDFLGRMKTDNGKIAQRAAKRLKKLYPKLRIVAATSGFSSKTSDDENTVKYMKGAMADNEINYIDLVFVAYGYGDQEKWLSRNLVKIPAKVGIGVGGTFDQIIGNQRRSPNLFVNLHLEWLFRLITQPWRFKRVFTAFPKFPYRVYISSLKRK